MICGECPYCSFQQLHICIDDCGGNVITNCNMCGQLFILAHGDDGKPPMGAYPIELGYVNHRRQLKVRLPGKCRGVWMVIKSFILPGLSAEYRRHYGNVLKQKLAKEVKLLNK